MKAKDLRNKSNNELQKELTTQRQKLGDLAVEYRTKEVTNVKSIAKVKKDIARILTVLQGSTKGDSNE